MIDSANAVQCNALTVAAVDAALAAGAILKTQFGKSFTVLSKDGRQDLVTECDKKAEEVAIAILKQRFPTHAILAEESGWSGDRKAPVIWVIDPLDGTRNFASNVPTFSVSIAAVVKGVVVSSAIFAPMLNELFVAERGKGAYLNGERLQVSSQKNIQKALLATGYPYNMHENPLSCMEVSTRITKQGPMMLNFGSSVLHLAYVAAGRVDAKWHAGLKPWDFAAASLMIEEAGGRISLWDGNPLDIFSPSSVLGSNKWLHPTMLRLIKG